MASKGKDRVLVILQLSGGNDFLNTLVPYSNPLYYDYRPNLAVPEDQVLPINDQLGFHPVAPELKQMYDDGKMALIQGVGYPNPSRSHFRSMDIWHTCEPDKIGDEGWIGRVIRALDPNGENVLTGVSFGRGLPRALVAPGVAVASVANIETYGVLTGITGEEERAQALDVFSRVYSPVLGSGPVTDYIRQTGRSALEGADILKTAPAKYSSTVEYGDYLTAQRMKGAAQVHFAELGTRVFFTSSLQVFDNHANQVRDHAVVLKQVSETAADFYQDLRDHNSTEEVLLFMFTEFGRRAQDNGSGTDHGTGGLCWLIGDHVKGGLYGEYPSMKQGDLEDGGDLQHNVDFRSVYATILEQWLEVDSKPIVGGSYEQLDFLN